jgi:hypothetical protein
MAHGLFRTPLLQCLSMADWRQIQARIRKAKNASDPSAKLHELFQRTRDGMVAWELGALEEKNGRSDEAVKWYKTAAEKFRRGDWKKKAEDALTRLGAEAPEKQENTEEVIKAASPVAEEAADRQEPAPMPLALGEISEEEGDEEDAVAEAEQESQPGNEAAAGSSNASADGIRKKRRRGRRGGRGRRRKGGVGATPGLPDQAFASSGAPAASPAPTQQAAPQAMAAAASVSVPERFVGESARESQRPARAEVSHPVPQLPSERAAHGRTDPALSSRMAHLESLLRRLMASPLHRLAEADDAPAGPGVFLLSDSDQSSSYYIESCQTLRVGVGNLVRGVRSQKGNRGSRNFGETNLKERLAEHLDINEAKVSQYLKDHCVVRWIQLDDEAAHLAHFAIGILKTPLNFD